MCRREIHSAKILNYVQGHEGRLCGVCSENYGMAENMCSRCWPKPVVLFVLTAAAAWLSVLSSLGVSDNLSLAWRETVDFPWNNDPDPVRRDETKARDIAHANVGETVKVLVGRSVMYVGVALPQLCSAGEYGASAPRGMGKRREEISQRTE